jgi:hypothetical protein
MAKRHDCEQDRAFIGWNLKYLALSSLRCDMRYQFFCFGTGDLKLINADNQRKLLRCR